MTGADTDAVRDRIRAALAESSASETPAADGIPTFEVEREALHEALRRLRDDAGFDTATFVTAIDRHPDRPRFELVHQLASVQHGGQRVRVRTRLAEDDLHAPTVIDLWPGTAFMERECYDMFGVHFDGHDGLKRLLMPEGYGHHPLRKDFPHQGIEPDRLYRDWERERRRDWSPDA